MVEQLKAIPRLLRMARVVIPASFSRRADKDRRAIALWQREQSQRFLDKFKIKVCCRGDFPTQGLMVCNHLSYLDIIVIASQGPVVFVAKSDLSNWPVIGSLLKNTETILTYRNQPIKSAQTAMEIKAALNQKLPVVLFPEGTSTNGQAVKHFRSAFFQPAHDSSVEVTPSALMYTSENGNPEEDICYWGDHTFFSHLMKFATIQGIVAHLNLGERQPCLSDRKESAAYFYKEVSRLHLELKSDIKATTNVRS